MVRNESVARMVMFLCFGTAILSLAVHWRITTTQEQLEQPAAAAAKPPETADGASTPGVQPTHHKSGSINMRSLFFGKRQNIPALSSAKSSQTEVVVNLGDRRAYVYKAGEVIASYPIAIGKKGWETPTGSFRVTDMEEYPIWQHPITGKIFPSGADSPLGARWIGFWSDGRNAIGFHGTPDTHLLGSAISHGCIRMRNDDVRLLYQQVSIGTLVSVAN